MNYRITDSEFQELFEYTRDYINKNCIIRYKFLPGKAPGSFYTWMFYLRRCLFNHNYLTAIGKMFIYKFERIDPSFNFQITGLETAATPIVTALPLIAKQYDIDLNAFIVRKTRKEYGLLNLIEGLPNDKPALMVDDLSHSTSSLARCCQLLFDENIPVYDRAFVVVSKTNKIENVKKDKYIYDNNLKIVNLFNLNDFGLNYD